MPRTFNQGKEIVMKALVGLLMFVFVVVMAAPALALTSLVEERTSEGFVDFHFFDRPTTGNQVVLVAEGKETALVEIPKTVYDQAQADQQKAVQELADAKTAKAQAEADKAKIEAVLAEIPWFAKWVGRHWLAALLVLLAGLLVLTGQRYWYRACRNKARRLGFGLPAWWFTFVPFCWKKIRLMPPAQPTAQQPAPPVPNP
jgi:hypothetical protein